MKIVKNTVWLLLASSLLMFGCASEEPSEEPSSPGDPTIPEQPDEQMPRGSAHPPTLGQQMDRAGRPAVTTALIQAFNFDEATRKAGKESYNRASQSDWPNFKDEIKKNLAILDSLDTECGNQLVADEIEGNRYELLATVLSDDQLYLNSDAGECGVYLGLEAEVVGAVPAGAGKCGGRTPSDDIIERSYSVFAAGTLTGVDDTITADDGIQTDTFPFLGAPTMNN